MRFAILSFSFTFLCFISYAGGLKGHVTTQKGEKLPYAGISVKGTSNGTMANDEGYYEFTLAEGKYEIVFQYLGFKTITKSVIISAGFTELNMVLEEQALNLGEATVGSQKEDPAYSIMRKAIAKARFHQLQVRSYSAKVYSRASAIATKIPFLLEKRLKKQGIEEGKAFLNESVSEVAYRRPSTYNQKIISTRNSLDNSIPSPNEYILASLYSPVVAGTITPLSPKAFSYYRFEYEGYFEDQGQIVNKIKVIPKAYGEGVFKGSLYILEDRWAIHSYDLQTTTSGLDISAKQIFSPIQDVWIPVNQQFRLKGGYLGFAGEFKYLVSVTYQKLDVDPNLKEGIVISDHKKDAETVEKNGKEKLDDLIRQQKQFSTKDFRKLTKAYEKEQRKESKTAVSKRLVRQDSIVIDTMANKRDTTYWTALRPIPLTELEVKGYKIQDSIKVVKEATNEKSRPDSVYFKAKHLVLGNTYALGNRNYFYFKSPVFSIGYNSVEANALGILTEWKKEWGKSEYFSLSPFIRYSFGRDRLYGTLEARRGGKNWNMTVTGGELASQINQDNPILPFPNSLAGRIFDRSLIKLFQNQFIRGEYTLRNIKDIVNFTTSIEYQRRKELFNFENAKSLFFWRNFDYTPNRPLNDELANTGFPIHHATVLTLNTTVRPWRRYIIRNGDKRYLRNRGPAFNLNYKVGLPALGDVNYSLLQGGVSQEFDLGPRSTLSYLTSGGGFLGKKNMYFIDYKHFMGNEFFFQMSDPLAHFRMLPYYKYSTSSWFAEAHVLWTLQRFLFTRMEFVRLTGVKETLQIHYLSAPTVKHYTELVYGFDDVLRVGRLELVGQFHGVHFQSIGFRIGTALQTGSRRR